MLESFLAVPLLWMNFPLYKALPIITSILSVLPFVVLALFLMRKRQPTWALLSLCFPIILPVEYGFLSSLSRGFVQAHLFVPLLLLPLFNPTKNKNSIILFLASGACLVSNGSSLLLVVPVIAWVFVHQLRSPQFYLSSLLVNRDRRTWLYTEASTYKTVLLNGFNLNPAVLSDFNPIDLGKDRTLIRLNGRSANELFDLLN